MKGALNVIICSLFLLIKVLAQGLSPSSDQSCLICHVDWSPGWQGKNSLLYSSEFNRISRFKFSLVTEEENCYSCHDGYVMDSRDFFLQKDAHKRHPVLAESQVFELPVDFQGRMYCGTCHTPHVNNNISLDNYKPFLRFPVKNSRLCGECHTLEYRNSEGNHPLHVPVKNIPLELKNRKTDPQKVECLHCHQIHKVPQTKFVAGKDRSSLCLKCHSDKKIIENTDHDLRNRLVELENKYGWEIRYKDPCAACHDVHRGSGKWLWVDRSVTKRLNLSFVVRDTLNYYCLDCHSTGGVAADKSPFFDSLHIDRDIKRCSKKELLRISGRRMTCFSCHDPHRWSVIDTFEVSSGNEEGNAFTSFLLFPDDKTGLLCTACHIEKVSITLSDHSLLRKGFKDYLGSQWSHSSQCSICHDAHSRTFKGLSLTPQEDLALNLCMRCHNRAKGKDISTIDSLSHPLHITFNSTIQLPGYVSGDSLQVSCISCHDPHLWGEQLKLNTGENLKGDESNSFLRVKNTPDAALCLTCHQEKKYILNSSHNLAQNDSTKSTCSYCHSIHHPVTSFALIGRFQKEGNTFGERHCLSCHRTGGLGSKSVPSAVFHPRQYAIVSPVIRFGKKWSDFPLFLDGLPASIVGYIDCTTCHAPHRQSGWLTSRLRSEQASKTILNNFFLRNPSTALLCTDCHQEKTLWKYLYFHDKLKRKRY